MKTDVNVPIRLRVDADALSADAELLERLVSESVEKVLARAAGALAKHGHAGPPVFHPPRLLWSGPGLGDVTPLVRADMEARIRRAVEAQVAKHRPTPPAPRRPAAVRPWFVVKDVYFHLTPRDFFKFRDEVMYEGELINPLELYAHMLDERRRAVAWLVQVNQEFVSKTLGREVRQRFSVLSKVTRKQALYAPFVWSDRLLGMLAGMDLDGVVRGALPSLEKYREKYLEGRTEGAKAAVYIKPGGRVLFVFMALPGFDLTTLVRGEPVLDRTLPLRELDALVDTLTFEALFSAPWADVRKAYGDEPVPLSLEPFTVEQPVQERSLAALFEGRRRAVSGIAVLGRTLLLSDESLAPLTPAARALLEPLSNPETRAVRGLPPQGRQWKPGWRGVSVTPRFGLVRERLEIVSWHPWAQRNAAELAGYLRLGKYDRRDRLRHWLIATWPDTDRWALLDLLLLELERLGVLEQFLQLLRDEAPNVGFYLRPVVRLLEKTRYAPRVKRLGVVEAYSRATQGLRRHTYDVEAQELRPWHEQKRRVRAGAGAVLADHVYIFQEKFDALRPTEKTMERLAGPARKRAGELMGELLCEGKQRTQEELIAQAVQEAAEALVPPLGEKDFEKVEVSISYRLVALELADPHDPSSIRVRYRRVRRMGDGPWEDVSEDQVDDVEKFAGYLAAYEIANMRRGVETLATIELLLIGGFFAAQAGVVGVMVRVAGGRLPVLLAVAAREAIYLYKVATGQEEFTLGGFLLNAFKGWLDAVGFRFGSMGGLALGKLITAGGVRLLLAGATARILTRALGVGISFVVEQFVEDVIVLVRCNRWQGSARKYVQQLGFGFAVGLGFELVAPLLGAAAKPLLERLKPLLRGTQDKLEVLKILLKELTPEQAALWLRLSMERIAAALRELLDNPKVLQEMAEALRGKARELVDALPDALKALKAAPGRAAGAVRKEYKVAFFQELFDLAGIELRGPVLEGFERLLGAAGTRDVYGLVRTLLKQKGASGFIASLRALEVQALERLLANGELERILRSTRLTDFMSTRGGLGWGLLERVFDGSAVKLEALLKDLEPLAPDAREAVLRLLDAHGHALPPAMRGNVGELSRLAGQEGTPGFQAELATLGRQTRVEALLRQVTPEAVTRGNARAILDKVKQAEKAGKVPVSYELRQEILTRSGGELQTIEAYTYEIPKDLSYDQMSRWLADPAHWLPERRVVQQQLVQSELAKAQALSARLNEPDVVYALRGNTAAGKTTTVKRHPTLGPKALDPSGELSGVINPDTIKGRIVELERGVTSSQAHREGSMLSGQVEESVLAQEGSALVYDRRFSWPKEIPELLNAIGRRRLKLIDIDVSLETSAVRVLMRNPGSADPLVPFDPVAQGFLGIRQNRKVLIEGEPPPGFRGVKNDPRVSDYELYVTNAQGQSVLVASKRNGTWVPPQTEAEAELFEQAVRNPASLEAQARAQVIDDAFIQRMTASISDPGYKEAVKKRLLEYRGKTLKDALDAHSKRLQ
ncbi:XopAJ/AvrRxo1 family type III secretion system effector zeta toxin [Myxococcus sp. RHSTA-1-4]|uniref:XopAJ/AvrRxo1 family type III secretion system effector zeta toxin n=1 Tax=Myxococcus sp. RHSTA-1-4 TaxID=2874601 RepID=UPI001CC075DE|nr:XopAJ/AvrRxo1 family type III secretion system effector zeta toxin [Myxococcus sp. RHSTA-1-4]MBZ4422783.1 hypothetical protein [Myxococcus sp. RHSTA-1-4]